jgi:hypothetical protein
MEISSGKHLELSSKLIRSYLFFHRLKVYGDQDFDLPKELEMVKLKEF